MATNKPAEEPILSVKDLKIDFRTFAGPVHAIRDVSFDLKKGETLAIVGESGSGKSVTVRSIMGLLANNAHIASGQIMFHDADILKKTKRQLNAMRGNDIAMIFQDPMTSLDPTMPIGKQVAEPLRLHTKISEKKALAEAVRVLKLVGDPRCPRAAEGLPPPILRRPAPTDRYRHRDHQPSPDSAGR
jgi:oligopeptide transport system ATP-binding protein